MLTVLLIIWDVFVVIGLVRVLYFREMYITEFTEHCEKFKLGRFRRIIVHVVSLTYEVFTWPELAYKVIMNL